tara:strand:+ start:196 stop:951 length:756 start_codon:yes stop_codon:yes gene_type:complete
MGASTKRLNVFGLGGDPHMSVLGPDISADSATGIYLVPQSGRDVEIFDDFVHSSYSATIDGEGQWGATIDSGGTITCAPAEGGHLVMTTDTTDDDDLQLHSHDEWFLFDSTKNLSFECRVKCDNTDVSLFYGLAEIPIVGGDANATILAESCVGFHLDEDANLFFVTSNDTTNTDTDTGFDVTADTFNTLTFTYTAADTTWRAYVDGVLKVTDSSAVTNPASEMGIVMSMRNGDGSANVTTIDYVYCNAEM